jgi:hypothetical protein
MDKIGYDSRVGAIPNPCNYRWSVSWRTFLARHNGGCCRGMHGRRGNVQQRVACRLSG